MGKVGHKHSEETKAKIRESNKRRFSTKEAQEKRRKSWEDPERRRKASLKQKELWKDEKYKEKMSVTRKKMWDTPEYRQKHEGCVCSPETREKLRDKSKASWTENRKKQYGETQVGKNNHNWKGGVSFLPYAPEFNKALKRKIKQRDNYTCQNPNCPKTHKLLSIHHIDYNKQNCTEINLITLCMPCNQRANGNREYWTELYQKIVNDTITKNKKLSITS